MTSPTLPQVLQSAEAAGALAVVGIARRVRPMPSWSRLLGTAASPEGFAEGEGMAATGVEGEVGLAVGRAGARLPWHTTCLDRAAAAQMMLRRRGRAGTVVIGLAPQEGWGAHAWLVGSTGVVVGGAEAARFAPATIFT